jgi:hypothetical protein
MAAVSTILDQWEVLQLHFQLASQSERCYTAKQLCEMYGDEQNKLYLLCMRQILKEITRVNILFQSEQVEVLKLTEDLMNMFATLMQFVVIPSVLSKCSINDMPTFLFRNHLMPTSCVHFGYEFEQCAATLQPALSVIVRERCKDFVVELIAQVQSRLPDNIRVLLMLSNLHPTVATSQQKAGIAPLAIQFRQLAPDLSSLENEWNSLHLVTWPADYLRNSVKFWAHVNTIKDAADKQRYGNISRLALALLSLPFSNATVERLFSLMNVVHTKLRNRLQVRSTEAILQIRYGLKRQELSCTSFQPTPYMIQHFFDKGLTNISTGKIDEDDEIIGFDDV